MIGALGGALLRGAGGALAKGAARGAGKKLIGGRNKKQNQIIKRPNQGQEQGGSGALVVRPKTALIPASDIPARRTTVQPKTTAGVSGKSTLEKIDKEVLEIRKLLGKSVKEEDKDVKNKKKLFEKERRKRTEGRLEKKPNRDGSGIMGGLNKISPGGGGIFGFIQNFIFSVLGGKILLFLLDNKETVVNIVKTLAAATGFIIDLGGKILDGIIGLVDGVYSVTDAIGKEIEGVGGEQAGKEYNRFLGTFNKFINLAMILAMAGVPANLGGSKNLIGGGKNLAPKSIKLPGGKPVQLSKFAGYNQAGGFGTGTNKSTEYMNRSRATKLIERKYGNEAARAYQNSYKNAIESGKSPAQAAQKAKANINKLFKKGQIIPQPAGGGLSATGGARASGRFGGVFRRGFRRAGSRLQTRIMGRGARLATRRFGAAASRFASKIKIPIIGPLIMGINTYMETGRLDRALFSAGGAALGGLLGNLIPIPILGSIIGTLAGEYVGDIFFELIRGGGISAVGAKLKRDMMKVINGITIFKDWMLKGISNIQNYNDGKPKIPGKIEWEFVGRKLTIPLQWLGIPEEGFKLGGWATLLNPFNLNIGKKFDILRQSFFKSSMTASPKDERINKASGSAGDDGPTGGGSGNNNGNNKRGTSDQDDPNGSGGNKPQKRTLTKGGGIKSLPSGSGNITAVPFDDPNFSPGTTRKKDTMIYLHWTAGNYNSASPTWGYHTIFTGDGGIVRNKSYDARGQHTEGKNSNSVGLSLAAMAGATGVNDFGSQPVTHEQLNQMAAEAARLAVKWGWEEGDIDRNVWTHAEAGSGLDPRGLSGHLDMNGDGKPDNYGMFNRASNEPMHRWDLYVVKEGGEPGSGGPILRDMIKKHYRNFKAELAGKEPPEGDDQKDKRGDSDQDDPKKAGTQPKIDKNLSDQSGGLGDSDTTPGPFTPPTPKNDVDPYTPPDDMSMKDFDPSAYVKGTKTSEELTLHGKAYYVRYEMQGNNAIVKQVNKRLAGNWWFGEKLGPVDPTSTEFKQLLESKGLKDTITKQTNLELKKVKVHDDIEKFYLYDKSYQEHYQYWLEKYKDGEISFEKAKQLAATAAKNAALMDMKKDARGNNVIDTSDGAQTKIIDKIDDDVRDDMYADTRPPDTKPPDTKPTPSPKSTSTSSSGGGGAFTDIFAGARSRQQTKKATFSSSYIAKKPRVIPKSSSSQSSSSSSSSPFNNFLAPPSDKNIIVPDKLNKDIALKNKADYEEEGQKTLIINRPVIVNANAGSDSQPMLKPNLYYS